MCIFLTCERAKYEIKKTSTVYISPKYISGVISTISISTELQFRTSGEGVDEVHGHVVVSWPFATREYSRVVSSSQSCLPRERWRERKCLPSLEHEPTRVKHVDALPDQDVVWRVRY
eukprot:1365769-Amorphochlora_amoeboformis.AAC.1